MHSHGFERSSVITGWRGTLTDIAVLAGRIGEVLGGGEVAAIVISEHGGRRHEYPGPNQLRAVAETIARGAIEAIDVEGRRGAVAAGEVVSVRVRHVNRRWRSGGLELRVSASSDGDAARMHSKVERAIRERVATRRLSWIGRAAGRPSFWLGPERPARRTRAGRLAEALIEVVFEALGATVIGLIVLGIWRLL